MVIKLMKVHAASYLSERTFCGRTLKWIRHSYDEPKKPYLNGNIVQVSKLIKDITCDSCIRCSE